MTRARETGKAQAGRDGSMLVEGRWMDERWMKDWGSGRRGEGTAAVCHVVVVVSV